MSCLLRPLCVAALAALVAGCAAGRPAPDFTLTSDTGRPWTLSAQRGKPVLLTFGFTHCADTCPATLAKLAHIGKVLGQRGAQVEIVMVTVDPRRDTPAALHAFVGRFGRPIVGLTGSQGDVRNVQDDYHVWAQRVPGRAERGTYDVAHTAAIYLIDSGGRIRGLHEDDEPEADIARAVRDLLS